MELLEVAVTNFTFLDKERQVDGAAMGSSLVVPFANVWIEKFEDDLQYVLVEVAETRRKRKGPLEVVTHL